MALPDSTITQACRAIAARVRSAFPLNEVHVMIGAPAAAAPGPSVHEHRLNLFFYRFEPSGIGADGLPGEHLWIRMFCLVTAFATEVSQGNQVIAAGENDLHLIGAVLRLFHETPLVTADVGGVQMRIQMTLVPPSMDDLNRLWSTQNDAVFRPSLGYEVSLVPILPKTPAITPSKVADLGIGVGPKDEPIPKRIVAPLPFEPPSDTKRPDWEPQIAFVMSGECAQTRRFSVGDPALNSPLPIAVAGVPNTTVSMVWEIWDALQGWRAANVAPVSFKIVQENLTPTAALSLPLPAKLPGQALLHAVRTWVRPDGTSVTIRSNPLLVTIHGGGA
jgi:hypothetical protein